MITLPSSCIAELVTRALAPVPMENAGSLAPCARSTVDTAKEVAKAKKRVALEAEYDVFDMAVWLNV